MKTLLAFTMVALFSASSFAANIPAPVVKQTQVLKCKDGSTSVVENRSGACSGHGGIDPKVPSNAPPPK